MKSIVRTILFVVIFMSSSASADGTVKLYGNGSNPPIVTFSEDILKLSPVLARIVEEGFEEHDKKAVCLRNIETKTLECLQESVEALQGARREVDVKREQEGTEKSIVIHVHALVEKVLEEQVSRYSDTRLKKVYQAAHYLQIQPLMDAFSYFIAERIWDTGRMLDSQEAFNTYIQETWLFKSDLLVYINEHLYLMQHGKKKKTIADHIGMHQQPYFDRRIDLSNCNLTSLDGIDLLTHAGEVKTLLLQNNLIVDEMIDPKFPQQPFQRFKNLTHLYLGHNHLSILPQKCFHGLPLQRLDLSHNRLKHLQLPIFYPLHQLRVLLLSHNQLGFLPGDIFQGLKEIQELYIDHNHIEEILSIFHHLSTLKKVSLEGNQLTKLPVGLFQDNPQLESLNFLNNPKVVVSGQLLKPLAHLSRLFIDEEQGKCGISSYSNKNMVVLHFCPS